MAGGCVQGCVQGVCRAACVVAYSCVQSRIAVCCRVAVCSRVQLWCTPGITCTRATAYRVFISNLMEHNVPYPVCVCVCIDMHCIMRILAMSRPRIIGVYMIHAGARCLCYSPRPRQLYVHTEEMTILIARGRPYPGRNLWSGAQCQLGQGRVRKIGQVRKNGNLRDRLGSRKCRVR